jgi:hypothetical protein
MGKKPLIIFDNNNDMWVDEESHALLKETRESQQKNIYTRYKDATITNDNSATSMFDFFTTICRSKFDNIVGWIKLKK